MKVSTRVPSSWGFCCDEGGDQRAHFVVGGKGQGVRQCSHVHVDHAIVRRARAAPAPTALDGRDVHPRLEIAEAVALAVAGDPVVNRVQYLACPVDRVSLDVRPGGVDKVPGDRDLHPGAAAMPRYQHHVGRFAEDAEIGDRAVRDRELGSHAVALVLRTLVVVHRRLLDLAGDPGDDDVAAEPDAGRANRLHGDHVGGQCTLHVEGAHAVDPFIVDQRALALVADAAMRLLGSEGRVQMTVEHQRFAAPVTLQAANGVVSRIADRLQRRVETRTAQHFMVRARHVPFEARRAGNVHQPHHQPDQPVPVDSPDCPLNQIRIYRRHVDSPFNHSQVIGVTRQPSDLTRASIRSPALSQLRTFIPEMTPGGLPVVITSPGSRVMFDHQATSSAML